jgi:hypothetical protein
MTHIFVFLEIQGTSARPYPVNHSASAADGLAPGMRLAPLEP